MCVKCISLNQKFATLIEKSDTLALVTQPSLALTVFRIAPKSASKAALSNESLNDLNRLFFGRLSSRTDIMLTQTTLNGVFCVRLAIGSARTTEKHITDAFDIVSKEADAAVEVWNQTVNGAAVGE